MNPDKIYFADANSTIRMTYGQVLDYYPADAVHYDYLTTLSGVMEKEDPPTRNSLCTHDLRNCMKIRIMEYTEPMA
jgi:hypothetical protein